jgi:hypothetical protein
MLRWSSFPSVYGYRNTGFSRSRENRFETLRRETALITSQVNATYRLTVREGKIDNLVSVREVKLSSDNQDQPHPHGPNRCGLVTRTHYGGYNVFRWNPHTARVQSRHIPR